MRADSDWYVRRSTTGYYIRLAMASISHRSKRQHCIAMSSCEAELMALADAALELAYVQTVLTHVGHEFADEAPTVETSDPKAHKLIHRTIKHGPTVVETDSKAAHDSCHKATIPQGARHVQRKALKMREFHHLRRATVALIKTDENAADLFTKALDNQTFHRHRATIMNLAAAS